MLNQATNRQFSQLFGLFAFHQQRIQVSFVCSPSVSFTFTIMVEQFVGTWTLVNSDKFDDYMKAVGVNFATRQMGILAKPDVVINVGDDGFITLKSVTTFKTTEFKFKLNEECDEDTPDGRATKTTMTIEDGKLVQKQAWDGKTTRIEREIQDGKLIAKCYMDDVVAVRTYEKAA